MEPVLSRHSFENETVITAVPIDVPAEEAVSAIQDARGLVDTVEDRLKRM